MAELVKFSGSGTPPGGVLGIGKHHRGYAIVEWECTQEISKVQATQDDAEIRNLKIENVILVDEEQVASFRHQLAEAKVLQGKLDPRQGSLEDGDDEGDDDLPLGDDESEEGDEDAA